MKYLNKYGKWIFTLVLLTVVVMSSAVAAGTFNSGKVGAYGNEGCGSDFWSDHTDLWVASNTDDPLRMVFVGADLHGLGDSTLLEALEFTGGPGLLGAAEYLLREGVAAILNGRVLDYFTSGTNVRAMVNGALASGDRDTIISVADELYSWNNAICELNGVVECGECEGKVTWLTLKYNGDNAAMISVTGKKTGNVEFDPQEVQPGEEFTVYGTDKKGTLGTEIRISVDGEMVTKIHTSCSQPIGVGMTFGDFEVVAGASLKGGNLCPLSTPPPSSGECEGKVTWLTLKYNGDNAAMISVTGKKKKGNVVFGPQEVQPGEEFTFNGTDKKGTLGTEIRISVDGEMVTKIHTSCSQPIGVGMTFGDFEVVAGASRNGGSLGP